MDSSPGKFALLLAYDGREFFGSQVQEDRRTVAGELARALVKGGFLEEGEKVSLASRTDRGVSAKGNVACYCGKAPIIGKINHLLPGEICVWASAQVPKDFSPRKSASKTYLYYLPEAGQNKSLLRTALLQFTGEGKDFSAFFQKDDVEKEAAAKGLLVEEASLLEEPGFLVLKFRAKRFLWMQVRKMAFAANEVSLGRMNLSLLQALLSPAHGGNEKGLGKEKGKGMGTLPGEGLLLEKVDYSPEIPFEQKEKTLSLRFSESAFKQMQSAGALSRICRERDSRTL